MSVVAGLGTKLQLSISSTLTDIANEVEIDGPDWQVGTAETSVLTSTVRTYRPTIPDSGELTMTIYYDETNATHTALTALMTTPAVGSWKLIFVDTHSYAFSGILTQFKTTGMTIDDNLSAEITIKLTGAITVA